MKTAVEWLESEFVKLEHKIGVHNEMYKLIEQAKEMEKKYIIIFADKYDAYVVQGGTLTAEQYYNETFKKK
jgi:hypothetical protein